MEKKIVAIGGGEIQRLKASGEETNYEIKEIHREILNLANVSSPNVLLLAHASMHTDSEYDALINLRDNFEQNFECSCKRLLISDLNDKETVDELINWADVIYEHGGDTEKLMDLWQKTGFDKKIIEAYENGKVIAGISAGAISFFKCGNTYKYLEENVNSVDGIGLVDAYFCPHIDDEGRSESTARTLEVLGQTGIALSSSCAIEIIDDSYRLIKDTINSKLEPYGVKSYWLDGEYIEERIDDSLEYKPLSDLLEIKKRTL